MELKLNLNSKDKPLLGSVGAINLYKVKYQYTTNRGNVKKRIKEVISEDSLGAKIKLLEYVNEFNRNNPHRVLSNVEILGTSYVDDIKIIIE